MRAAIQLLAAAGEAGESDSMARATELMDLIKSPTAIATGVLIVFARDELHKNATNELTKSRSRNAFLAALAALIITATVVVVMIPLLVRVVILNAGNGLETRLLVYVLTFIVAVGTVLYVATALWAAAADWRDAPNTTETETETETD